MRISATGRRRAWIVGLVAILLAGAWLAWANRAGRREAGRLLAYHRDQYQFNRGRWLDGLDGARKSIEGPKRSADQFRRQAEDDAGPGSGHGLVGGRRSLLEGLDEVDRRLADLTLSADRANYHARMAAFYEDALGSWGAGLHSVPEALEVDRRLIALQMYRRYKAEMDHGEMVEEVALYDAEPPRRLPAPVTGRP